MFIKLHQIFEKRADEPVLVNISLVYRIRRCIDRDATMIVSDANNNTPMFVVESIEQIEELIESKLFDRAVTRTLHE